MSAAAETQGWFDKYWQVLLVAFGVGFTLTMVYYKP